jgi:hypothetical protein
MNDDRRSILNLLAEGKITADEAERLLSALDRAPAPSPGSSVSTCTRRYLALARLAG